MVLVVIGNLNLCFVGQVCHRIGVLEDEFFSLGERLLVGHEEVHDSSFRIYGMDLGFGKTLSTAFSLKVSLTLEMIGVSVA